MKEKIFLGVKGFLLGVANVIPGVSGGTIAIIFGIYDKLLESISGMLKHFKKSCAYLLPIVIGAVLAILSTSKVVSLCLSKYPVPTVLFFVGLIIGGMNLLTDKIKGKVSIKYLLFMIITFGLVVGFGFLNSGSSTSLASLNAWGYIKLFLVGIVAAATMIIPGISGSFMLMLLGYYEPVINTISDLTTISHLGSNLAILIPFGLGAVVGLVGLAKLLLYLLKHHETAFYFVIIGFILSSIVSILLNLKGATINVGIVFVSILTFFWGFFVSRALSKEKK